MVSHPSTRSCVGHELKIFIYITSFIIPWNILKFKMSRVHSPIFQSLHLRHSSFWFSKLSVTSPTSQFIPQPFFRFSYVTSSSLNSPGEPAELILQPFRHFIYVTTHSPTLPSLYLHHSSFSNPSFASPMSQFILQPFFCFSYVTSSSLNSPGELPMVFSHLNLSVFLDM